MSDDERIDREAILKRRLLLIGTALVGLSACSAKEPPPEPCLSPPYEVPPEPCLSQPVPPDSTTASTGTGTDSDPVGAGGAPPQACLSVQEPKLKAK